MKSFPPWNPSTNTSEFNSCIHPSGNKRSGSVHLLYWLTTTFTVTLELAVFHACPAQESSNGYAGGNINNTPVLGIKQGIQDTT
jgi:hypothetical protein